MIGYAVDGLEIRVGDGDRTEVRYYVSRTPGRGWRWDAYLGDLGGVSAGHSTKPLPTRDDAVTAAAEHYAARLGQAPTLRVVTATAAHITFQGFGHQLDVHDGNTGQKIGQVNLRYGFAFYLGVKGGAHEGVSAVVRGGVDGLRGALRVGLSNDRDDRT